MVHTDQDRMNFLEKIFSHNSSSSSNRIVLRRSLTDRGMRLHHCSENGFKPNFPTVREAIDDAIETGIE